MPMLLGELRDGVRQLEIGEIVPLGPDSTPRGLGGNLGSFPPGVGPAGYGTRAAPGSKWWGAIRVQVGLLFVHVPFPLETPVERNSLAGNNG